MDEFLKLEGVQDLPPQNMQNWHIDYFKQESLETQKVREGLSDLPLCT